MIHVAIADRDVSGAAAGELLLSDYAVATPAATIAIDSSAAWAGVVWRIGRDAMKLRLGGKTTFTASEALQFGLIDEITSEPEEWRRRFFEGRSAMALDSAAMLMARRGGDALERAEFARLFAAGEPQRGLRAFLNRRTPQF